MLPCSNVLPLLCFLCLHAPVFFLVRLTVFKLFSVTALHALLHVFCWQYLHLFFCWLLSLYQRLCCHFPLPFALELNIGVFCTKWFCNAVRYSSSVAMKPNEDILDCSVVSQSFSFCSFLFSFCFCYLSSSSPLPLRICGDSRPFLSANYHGCCGRSSPGWRHRKGVAFCPSNNVVGCNWANRVVLAQFPHVREARRFLSAG